MRIDHIAVAVEDLDSVLSFYRDALGIEITSRRIVPDEGVEIGFLQVGESHIEMIRPLDMENSVGRFLHKRGEGMHHICFLVDDIDAAIHRLIDHGAQMATEIKSHPDGTRYAFLHPKSSHGVLIELYDKTSSD